MNTGLSGAISGIKRVDPLKAIIGTAVIAGVILIAKKAGVPMGGFDAMAVAFLLGVAALGAEYYLSKEATRSFVDRSLGSMCMFGVLWAAAFSYGVCQWIGAAAENEGEKARTQKAAFVRSERANSALQLAQDAAAAASRREDNLRRAVWESIPKVNGREVTTVAEAKALVEAAKNHRWWDYTSGCQAPRGRDSQKWCDGYRDALAAIPAAERREVAMEELNAAMADTKAKREAYQAELEKAGHVSVQTSERRDDLRILTTYGGMSEQAAADVTAFGKVGFVSLMISGLGILGELREHRGVPRRPWPWTLMLRRIWRGRSGEAQVEAAPMVTAEPVPARQARQVPMLVNRTVNDREFAAKAADVLAKYRAKALAREALA